MDRIRQRCTLLVVLALASVTPALAAQDELGRIGSSVHALLVMLGVLPPAP